MRERGPDVKVVGNLSPVEENEQAGIKPYNIPENNFHIIPEDFYHEIESSLDNDGTHSTAITLPRQQMILFTNFAKRHPVIFANEAFHEALHLKAPFVFEKEKSKIEGHDGKEQEVFAEKLYRSGFEVNSALSKDRGGEKHSHFSGLNEAFVSLLEKQFTANMIKDMEKQDKHIAWLQTEEARKMKEKIAQENNCDTEAIFWMSTSGGSWCRFSYPKPRETLQFIISEIRRALPKKYKSEQDVLSEFSQSYFTGKLLPLARLIEKVFGKGSFEALGMMTTDRESAVLTKEYFQRHRPKQEAKG